jgi:hypothetical protein
MNGLQSSLKSLHILVGWKSRRFSHLALYYIRPLHLVLMLMVQWALMPSLLLDLLSSSWSCCAEAGWTRSHWYAEDNAESSDNQWAHKSGQWKCSYLITSRSKHLMCADPHTLMSSGMFNKELNALIKRLCWRSCFRFAVLCLNKWVHHCIFKLNCS